MKKLLTALVIIGLFTSPLYAMSVGDTATTVAKKGNFTLSCEFDKTFERDLEKKNLASASYGSFGAWNKDNNIESKEAEIDTDRFLLKANLTIISNVDLFIKAGVARTTLEYKFASSTLSGKTQVKAEGDWDYLLGVGLKAKLFEFGGGYKVFGSAQFQHYEADADESWDGVALDNLVNNEVAGGDFTSQTMLETTESQVSIYVTRSAGAFAPYLGMKYSDVRVDHDIVGGDRDGDIYTFSYHAPFEAKDNFGLFTGFDYAITDHLNTSLEIRGLDELGGSLGISYLF